MVGTLGGFFGVGGAWIVTPALNIFGFPMAYAIGTDLAHIFGKSIIATRKHSKMGNVDWRLGTFSIAGSIIGIELGKRLVLFLEAAGNVGDVVRWVYMIFLFGLGIYMTYDYMSAVRRAKQTSPGGDANAEPIEQTSAAAIKHPANELLDIICCSYRRIEWVTLEAGSAGPRRTGEGSSRRSSTPQPLERSIDSRSHR